MSLPFIILDSCYHVGSLTVTNNGIVQRSTKNWDFELGLLSVSLDPQSWIAKASYPNPTTYQITSPVKLLDADCVLFSKRANIEAQARSMGLISPSFPIRACDLLYRSLDLTNGSITGGGTYSQEDWVLLSCLAVIAAEDPSIDGHWFSSLQHGAFPSERGGIYQHRLSTIGATTVAPCAAKLAPSTVVMSTVLSL